MSIPTNIADVIAGIRDQSLGLQQVMIGDLVVDSLTGLSIKRAKEVTRRPVQAGYNVDLGVIDTPLEIEMSVVLANPDYSPEGFVTAALTGDLSQLTSTWREKRDQLYDMWGAKEILPVTTHDQGFDNLVIDWIEDLYDNEEDWEGYVGVVHLVAFGGANQDSVVGLENAENAAKVYVGVM